MSLPQIGVTLTLRGEKEYKQAISDISKVQKTLASEMEKLSTEYEDNAKSGEFLNKKLEVLSQQYEANQKKLEYSNQALDKATGRYTEASKKMDEYKEMLKQAKQTLEEMTKSSTTSADDIKKQEKAVADLEKSLQGAQGAIRSADGQMESWKQSINSTETNMIKMARAVDETTQEISKMQDMTVLEGFAGSVKDADSQISVLTSDMGKLSDQFSQNEKSVEALNAKQVLLGRTSEEVQKKTTSLKNALEFAEKAFGENSSEADKLRKSLASATAESSKIERALKSTAEATQSASLELEKLQKAEGLSKLTKAADEADKNIKVLSSEMKALSAQYADNEKSTEALA